MSSTAGEMLRVEGAVRNEDVVDTDSASCRLLEVFVLAAWLVDGRRDSGSVGGVAERLVVVDDRLPVGATFIDSR